MKPGSGQPVGGTAPSRWRRTRSATTGRIAECIGAAMEALAAGWVSEMEGDRMRRRLRREMSAASRGVTREP